ncbi:MAG: SGNH/GDSL hydrolase family protein [Planctomycetes bacterium]|nr:SGNH/GDSL hydrolase family protein [Planctomycetota bacterium]
MSIIQTTLEAQNPCRIVALGSSNTERAGHAEGRYNWFDWLDVALRMHYGRIHHSINVGMSGETSSQLIARFDTAVTVYQPHIVLLTVGGNDSNPEKNMGPGKFKSQLTQLVEDIRKPNNALCILQTYYSAVEEEMDPVYFKQFHNYMQIIRDVAAATDAPLIDNLQRWERLRKHDKNLHKSLMRDAMHVKPLGNMLWGLDVARHFGVFVDQLMQDHCSEGLRLQQLIDGL